MKRPLFRKIKQISWIVFVGMFAILIMPPGGGAMDDASRPTTPLSRILSARQAVLTIQEKTPVDFLSGGSRYIVTPATLIVSGDDEVSYRNLPVPCTARVYFEKNAGQDPEVLKIEINDVAVDASIEWTPAKPE